MTTNVIKWIAEAEYEFYCEKINLLVKNVSKEYKKQPGKVLTKKFYISDKCVDIVAIPRKEDENLCDILLYDDHEELFFDCKMGVFNKNVKYFEELLTTPVVESLFS